MRRTGAATTRLAGIPDPMYVQSMNVEIRRWREKGGEEEKSLEKKRAGGGRLVCEAGERQFTDDLTKHKSDAGRRRARGRGGFQQLKHMEITRRSRRDTAADRCRHLPKSFLCLKVCVEAC
jgi:hypothetical protein